MLDELPQWTVMTNIVSPENDQWVGTCWEFFAAEAQATRCYQRHIDAGNCPTKRPFFRITDVAHMGAAHRF